MLQMWRKGRPITVQGDYIFGLDRQNFLNVGVIETRVTTDHMMVLACLRGSGDHQNRRYLWVCTIWSIAPLEGGGESQRGHQVPRPTAGGQYTQDHHE